MIGTSRDCTGKPGRFTQRILVSRDEQSLEMAPGGPEEAMDRQIRQRLAKLETRLAQTQRKSPKQKPSRKARKANRPGTVMSGSTSGGGFSNLPLARSFNSTRSSYFRTKALPRHETFGHGVVVEGCEVGLNVVTAAAASDFFTTSVATAATVNLLNVSPDAFNGRLALVARTYSRYRFRRLIIHFVPALGSANPGIAAMGYSPDGSVSGFATTSFAQTTQTEPSVVFSLNAPVSWDVLRYNGTEMYWTEIDYGTAAGNRQTIQGVLAGFPSTNALGVLTQGVLWFEYVVELYAPSADYGFTMSRREQQLASAYIARLRLSAAARDHDSMDDDVISIESKKSRRA